MTFVNTAARLITDYRIHFKILIISFKAINGMTPSYLSNLVSVRSSNVYSLRSNDTVLLDRPRGVIPTTLGARSFPAACGSQSSGRTP